MYLVGHIRKIGDFTDGTKLFFQPDEEVVDAGAADCHLEVGVDGGYDAETATRLLYYALDRFHGNNAATRNFEECIWIKFLIHNI